MTAVARYRPGRSEDMYYLMRGDLRRRLNAVVKGFSGSVIVIRDEMIESIVLFSQELQTLVPCKSNGSLHVWI